MSGLAGISDDEQQVHRKRLGQMLRYIASMQSSTVGRYDFVRETRSKEILPFFHDSGSNEAGDGDSLTEEHKIIFTTLDFQRLNGLEQEMTLFQNRPFAFYSVLSEPSSLSMRRKSSRGGKRTAPCWLRLTRPTSSEPVPVIDSIVQAYLDEWRETLRSVPVKRFLTLERLSKAPKSSHSRVKLFLQQYKKYLKRQEFQKKLETIYNRLFEWLQDHNDDLIWGLGLAQICKDGQAVSGPLLEVRMEVELAKDGALLVRPREHTGVSLNRDVLSALAPSGDNTARTLSQTVNELDTCQLSPGQPETFIPLLKRMAVELSSEGKFISVSKLTDTTLSQAQGLVVSDAFCLYSNPKPSAVWARDALKFAEELSDPDFLTPRALWSLTHGAGMLDKLENAAVKEAEYKNSFVGILQSILFKEKVPSARSQPIRPLFPLPTSTSQNHIAELLLEKNYPAVVCEGPPGTGKTHTIANIICAYLTQGKRVLVTSKGAPALSVLRGRLPPCVQDLCVDVSMSESAGMRQLQQTVERLANKVSWASTERESKKCQALMDKIGELEDELKELDLQMSDFAERKRKLVETARGREFFQDAVYLITEVPWFMKTISRWNLEQITGFQKTISDLSDRQEELAGQKVTGFVTPPSDCLISLVAAYAGGMLSSMKQSMQGIFARFPVLGPGLEKHRVEIRTLASELRLNGARPESKRDWKTILEALQLDKSIEVFCSGVLRGLCEREDWPIDYFMEIDRLTGRQKIRAETTVMWERVVQLWHTSSELGVQNEIKAAIKSRVLDVRRSLLSKQLQELATSLVDAKVVAELSKSFSAEAQSSLIQFSQIAGKAKFGTSAQPSKMTARQRRRRQEYLNSFAKCVQFIPCWILTSSQLSDYLPPTCCFDLVVLDESSQSDISILPGMLRAKQWLVVGDSKQVSPT